MYALLCYGEFSPSLALYSQRWLEEEALSLCVMIFFPLLFFPPPCFSSSLSHSTQKKQEKPWFPHDTLLRQRHALPCPILSCPVLQMQLHCAALHPDAGPATLVCVPSIVAHAART